MPTVTITRAGRYHVWAAPHLHGGPVTITISYPDSTLRRVHWSATDPEIPPMPEMPTDESSTRVVLDDVPVSAVVSTTPHDACLIIHRRGDITPLFDNARAGKAAPLLPAPRPSNDAAPGSH